MNEHLITIPILKLILFFQIYSYILTISCPDNTFCFQCISDNSCTWNSNSCKNISEEKSTKPSITTNISPKKCFEQNDTKTVNHIKKYCGKLSYEFSNDEESISISLPMHDKSLYGTNKLYCEYTIYNEDSIGSFTIQTRKKWGSVKMRVKYFTSSKINEIILGDGDKHIIMDSELIKIVFESNNEKNTSPFEVKITKTFSSISKYIIALIVFCSVLGIIVIIILLIIWSRRPRRRSIVIKNNINNLNNIYINNINVTSDSSSGRVSLMNYLEIVKPIKFHEVNLNKNELKGLKCPIDLEYFQPDSDVILTECLHVFHYDCLKTYIEKNKMKKELRCPLCNTSLYSTKIKETNDFNNYNNNFQK
jgi:hypothetical protein